MLSVSPSCTSMSSVGIPSSSATICAERRLVPLPLRLDAELEDRLAGGVHAELRRVEHPQAGDVVLLAVARADDLRERREARSRAAAPPRAPPPAPAAALVAELLERDPHRLGVVARVVDEPRRGLVRELLRLDEVVEPELRRVDAELVRGVVDEPLDQVRRLGDAERAAVGDAAGRLVRVVAVRDDVRGRDVVRAGDDVEQARPHLRRLRVGARTRPGRRGARRAGRSSSRP